MKYIHFTDSPDLQLEIGGGDKISQDWEGLFVYRYTDNFPLEKTQTMWNRNYVIIECPEKQVEFVQGNPVGNNYFDEYLIPTNAFEKAEIVF